VAPSAAGGQEAHPVLETAALIRGKWTLLVLLALSRGVNRFSTLERSLAGISPKTLSERLQSLEEAGIASREAYAEVPPRVEYTLTPMGQELMRLIDHMREYGTQWLMTADAASGARSGHSRRGR
jgi:DNA-binding HxlR family transcriptional regulator